jgi:hypothetical protein
MNFFLTALEATEVITLEIIVLFFVFQFVGLFVLLTTAHIHLVHGAVLRLDASVAVLTTNRSRPSTMLAFYRRMFVTGCPTGPWNLLVDT